MKGWLEISIKNGINPSTFSSRVNQYGWSPEKAATEPVRRRPDRKWQEIAQSNGISHRVYVHRVDNLFWSPEEAATTPPMTKVEVSKLGNQMKAEIKELMDERIFNDEENMFKLTPQHIAIAANNKIKERTVRARVYYHGWTVQDAISVPTKGSAFKRPEGYFDYLNLAKQNGIKESTFGYRVRYGWSLIDAAPRKPSLSNPTRPELKWTKLALKNGIHRETYCSRIKLGWSPEDAATTPPLKKGEYLNEQNREKEKMAFKKFRKVKKG
ncbi:hypothetical protein [Bacillus sp. UNC438CL73TsuS30]|uniref:hypothetical protein n=1 Tax=Bacillus sp. UNC438CL73TsuS30 TaxID=1340434 RepID=UPI00068A81D5|nr:hypothetical protein [Bacillus sp. UNC438CL73TsuS30]